MIKFLRNTFLFFALLAVAQSVGFAQGNYERAALWENEIKAFAKLDKKDFPSKKGILFVGSSSIRGWRTVVADFPEYRGVINRGFGGSHLEDLNHYAPQIVFPYKPKLIVLYSGENDIVSGKTVARVFADFKIFTAMLRKELPKTRLIFVSVKPSPLRWNFTPQFTEFNQLVKAETEKDKRMLFVDVWPAMLAADNRPKKEIYLEDDLHMNAEGYKLWRATLAEPIKKGLKGAFR